MDGFSEWFGAFLLDHRRRHPEMPDPKSKDGLVLYAAWSEIFQRERISEEAAGFASVRLLAEPARSARLHLATLLEYARAHQGRAAVSAGGSAADQAAARDADAKARQQAANDAWDAAAAVKWAATPEPERERWRDLVRERLPELARSAWWLEGLATAWCYDPSFVAALPEPEPPAANPFRRVFSARGSDPRTASERTA